MNATRNHAATPPMVPAVREVLLVGRANAGKTSLLMHLTGRLQRPINFPGTSVECIESEIKVGAFTLRIVDLPGIGSLRSVSRDEQVAIARLTDPVRRPHALCFVLDASRLLIDLRLLHDLRALGLPIVVALTKVDVARSEGFPVDVANLERALGLPLVVVDGASGDGAPTLRERLAADVPLPPPPSPSAVDAMRPSSRRLDRSRTDRLDAWLLHPVLGPVVLGLVTLLMFQLVFTVAEPFLAVVEATQQWLGDVVVALLPDGVLQSFLVDGVIHGVGSALVFVPQIALLIAFVTVVEATGYMARAVFLLDSLLRRFGLSGRSFVPLMSSFGCAIPGIAASRILADERDRLATIAVLPLMSCSARLPVYVVLLAAFFPPHQAGVVLFLLYLLGIVVAIAVATLLRRTVLRGGGSLLVMELPVYQRPRWRIVGLHTWFAVKAFLRTAGTVILAATVAVWALAYFPRPLDLQQRFAAEREALTAAAPDDGAGLAALDAREAQAFLEQSWLASIGRAVQPVFAPAGFDWRLTVGVLAAFPARELVIPTLGTLHSLGSVEPSPDEPDPTLGEALRSARGPDGRPTMNALVAIAAMVFFALCSQCAGTLAAIRRETHTWRWASFTFVYMSALAWAAAVAVYQIGSWFGYGLPA